MEAGNQTKVRFSYRNCKGDEGRATWALCEHGEGRGSNLELIYARNCLVARTRPSREESDVISVLYGVAEWGLHLPMQQARMPKYQTAARDRDTSLASDKIEGVGLVLQQAKLRVLGPNIGVVLRVLSHKVLQEPV